MRFQSDLVPARLIRRYKRFLADCTLEDGSEIVAHCANPGSMMGLADSGTKVWLEPNDDPKKKLKYGLRLVDHENGHMTGVDTSLANRIVRAALEAREIDTLAAYTTVRAEVKYGDNSRVDFLLTEEGLPDVYVEVKSVTLCRSANLAEFPDSVTARGAKHMHDLANVARMGHRAVLLYLVQRTDCTHVDIAADIDPTYAAAHADATKAGVETICIGTDINPQGISISAPLALGRPAR
ncbi:DNA/RNA nuclease SfsA [Sulfitobacter guttiformis]|uniref:Sugar fermentation stimulation protein homolog n=1 Tax=Sulfitobacter guttiformis TaxID=74349 RepID=A0A420DR69_9RHOB|nr:DNA/RNA nuclease SfsA [Sulfitobacter guttiformis]KIN74115.1 sugar fermentation stimulation protein [Sulfitobacter guttiformis KCTC 32187]RKE96732.1 sugar fermentation stimulation protein A [Sulfitobacter guttiformis]